MPDRILMQRRIKADLLDHAARSGQVGQIGGHIGDVQFGAVGSIGRNSPIGDDQGCIVSHQPQFMWPDALGLNLANARIIARNIPQANRALTGIRRLFAGGQHRAALQKHAMPVELLALWRGELVQNRACGAVDDQRINPRAAAKHHRIGQGRVARPGMAPLRQAQLECLAAIAGQPEQRETIPGHFGASQKRRVPRRRPADFRRSTGSQKRAEEMAAGGHDVSPHPTH